MKTNSPHSIIKKLPLFILTLCVVALFQGCENSDATQKKLRLAFVGNTLDDFWAIVRLGCDVATRQLGNVDLDFRFPAERTAAAQEEILERPGRERRGRHRHQSD